MLFLYVGGQQVFLFQEKEADQENRRRTAGQGLVPVSYTHLDVYKRQVWLGAGLMSRIRLSAGISSCTAMFTSTTSSVIATAYLSEDDAMKGAEAQYRQMEAELQSYLDNYESTHDYDEYHLSLIHI